jgi:hypothetical protein
LIARERAYACDRAGCGIGVYTVNIKVGMGECADAIPRNGHLLPCVKSNTDTVANEFGGAKSISREANARNAIHLENPAASIVIFIDYAARAARTAASWIDPGKDC